MRIRSLFGRGIAANFFMLSFIVLTSVGAGMISPEIGFIVAGATCGLFGYLLGLE
jgi:hypothetical protein